MKIWAKTAEFSEGKYLVVRRDGTIPHWPHFVLGGDDPCAPAALVAYSQAAKLAGFEREYWTSILELAEDFRKRKGGKADPDAPPHRKDNPAVIAMMRGQGDLSHFVMTEERERRLIGRIRELIHVCETCNVGAAIVQRTREIMMEMGIVVECLEAIAKV